MKGERHSLDFIRVVTRKYRRRTALLVALLVLSGLAESVGIAALLPLLELTTGGDGVERSAATRSIAALMAHVGIPVRLEAMLILISVAMILKGGFRLLAMKQVGYTTSRVAMELRYDFIDRLLESRWSYFVHQPLGRFANAIGAEVMRASLAYQHVCALFAVSVQVGVYMAFALLVSWETAVFALAAAGVLLLVHTPLVRRARHAGRSQNQLMKSISVRLTDALGGLKPIKAMGQVRYLRPVLRNQVGELNQAQERQVLAVEAMSATREPILVILLSLMIYVVVGVSDQSMAAVLVVAFLFTRLAGSISHAQKHYQEIAIGEAAYWSIQESVELAVREREAATGRSRPPPLEREIRVQDVTFAHGDRPVLERVSLIVPAGHFVALVGPSGSGKTTLADLLVGLYAPASGSILVDGVPLERVDSAAWRQQIGYVPQDALLFHDTVHANIALGDPTISRADVERALKAADAWDFTTQLRSGLDTVLGERGSSLSGGQRQRIAIARALARRPRLLILDEVTASLDPVTEAAVCDTLRRLRGEMTIFAISHQPLMMEVADIVYRLEHGRVKRFDPIAGALV